MIKYIIEILKLQGSIILPGFGSLQVANTKTGKIVFNPLLKFNDGTLAKYIAEKEGIDQQSAQNQVAKFVREIEAEIGIGHTFNMFQFGKFVKNKEGVVEFVQEGTPVEPSSEVKKPAAKETKPEAKPTEKKAETKIENKPAEKKAEVKVEEKKPVSAVPVKEEPLAEELKKESEAASEKPLRKLDDILGNQTIEKDLKTEKEIAESKQTQNKFTPETTEAKSAVKKETVELKEKAETKIPEITKNIPLAEASKKDPAAQEKNKFVPPVEAAKTEIAADLHKETPKVMAASVKEESKKGKEEPKKESVKEKFKKDKPQKVKNEVPKEKKKRSRWPRLIIFLIIIGGGATAAWMYQDKIKTFFFTGVDEHDGDSTAVTTNHAHDDSLVTENTLYEELTEDTTVVEEPVVEEPIVEEPLVEKPVNEKPDKEVHHTTVTNHSSPGGSYHIIGNSFSSKTNAENYVATMSGKGYSAQVLGKFDNLYLVSLKSYSSKEEAKSGLSSVTADAASAWVFKY